MRPPQALPTACRASRLPLPLPQKPWVSASAQPQFPPCGPWGIDDLDPTTLGTLAPGCSDPALAASRRTLALLSWPDTSTVCSAGLEPTHLPRRPVLLEVWPPHRASAQAHSPVPSLRRPWGLTVPQLLLGQHARSPARFTCKGAKGWWSAPSSLHLCPHCALLVGVPMPSRGPSGPASPATPLDDDRRVSACPVRPQRADELKVEAQRVHPTQGGRAAQTGVPCCRLRRGWDQRDGVACPLHVHAGYRWTAGDLGRHTYVHVASSEPGQHGRPEVVLVQLRTGH